MKARYYIKEIIKSVTAGIVIISMLSFIVAWMTGKSYTVLPEREYGW